MVANSHLVYLLNSFLICPLWPPSHCYHSSLGSGKCSPGLLLQPPNGSPGLHLTFTFQPDDQRGLPERQSWWSLSLNLQWPPAAYTDKRELLIWLALQVSAWILSSYPLYSPCLGRTEWIAYLESCPGDDSLRMLQLPAPPLVTEFPHYSTQRRFYFLTNPSLLAKSGSEMIRFSNIAVIILHRNYFLHLSLSTLG